MEAEFVSPLDRYHSGLDLSDSDPLFKPVNRKVWLSLVLIGMAAAFRVSFDPLSIRWDLFQYVVVLLTGYYWGWRSSLSCGLLVFLPNLVCYFLPISQAHSFMFSRAEVDGIWVLGFSIPAYLIYACSGAVTAVLREWLSMDPLFMESELESHSRIPFRIYILLYAASFQFAPLDVLRFDFTVLYFPIMIYLAYSRGFGSGWRAFWFTLPIVLAQAYFGSFAVGVGLNGSRLILLVMGMVLADHFGRQSRTGFFRMSFDPPFYFFLGLCLASAWNYAFGPILQIQGFALILGIVYAVGALCGRQWGFYLGMVAGMITAPVRFDLTETLGFGGTWWFALLALPLIGHGGGCLAHGKSRIMGAFQAFFILYLIEMILWGLQGTTRPETYLRVPLHWLLSSLAAWAVFLLTSFTPRGNRL